MTEDPSLRRIVLGMFAPMLAAIVMRLLVNREGTAGDTLASPAHIPDGSPLIAGLQV